MRISKGYLFRACYDKGGSHQHFCLADIQRQADERESFIWQKREGFKYPLIGGCCHGEALSGLTKSRPSNVIGYGTISGFLWLVLSWKQEAKIREAVNYWSSSDSFGPMATEAIVHLPGLTVATWESESYFCIWSGSRPFVYSVSQAESSQTLAQNFMTKLYCQFLNKAQVIYILLHFFSWKLEFICGIESNTNMSYIIRIKITL